MLVGCAERFDLPPLAVEDAMHAHQRPKIEDYEHGVPTFLASIWGMNFEHMPELSWVVGYPIALGTMLVVGLVLFRVLRRAGWL